MTQTSERIEHGLNSLANRTWMIESARRVEVLLFAAAMAGVLAIPSVVEAAGFSLVPVGATGEFTINGNEIVVPYGGTQVTLEIQVFEWDPSLLFTFIAQLDSTGYSSGTLGTLAPLRDPDAAAGFFVEESRDDDVFAGIEGGVEINTTTLDYFLGRGPLSGDPSEAVSDPGVPRYAATLIVEVPPDATGKFTLGFLGDGGCIMYDPDSIPLFPLPDLVSAQIRIKQDAVPAVSGWAAVVLALLILVVGAIVLRRREALSTKVL